MTVEVEVGDKLYTGSSVVEMTVTGHPEIPLVHGVRNLELEGEAVVAELPSRRYLFGYSPTMPFWRGIYLKISSLKQFMHQANDGPGPCHGCGRPA